MSGESTLNHKNRCRIEGKWILLGITCVCFLAHMYFTTAFVVVNGTVSEYFNKSPKYVGLLPALECSTAALTGIILIALTQNMEFRNLSNAAGAFLFAAGSAVTIGFMAGGTFWLIVFGVTNLGISFGMLLLLPPWMSDRWFPTYSPGLVFAIPYSFMYLGGIIAETTFKQSFRYNVLYNETSFVEKGSVEISFVREFGMMVLIAFGSAVLLCLCVEDQSQNIPRNTNEANLEIDTEACCCCPCISQLTNILSKTEFILMTISNMLIAPTQIYTLYRMPGLLSHRFKSAGTYIFTYLHIFGLTAGIIGCIVAVSLIMKMKALNHLPLIGSSITLLGSVLLCIGYLCNSLGMVGFFQEIMTFGAAFSIIANVEVIMNNRENSNRILTFSLYFGLYNLSLFLFDCTEILTAYNDRHEIFILIIPACSILAVVLIILATKVCKNPNSQQSSDDDLQHTERSSLLSPN